MALIRPTPITLLSSSILSIIKINGTQQTLPQFILDIEHHLRSVEHKSSRNNWFYSNLFWIIPNNYPSSLFQIHCNGKFSSTYTLDLPVTTWANKKHCTACNLVFSVQASEQMSPHGSKDALTTYYIMYGKTGNKNFIFIGQ